MMQSNSESVLEESIQWSTQASDELKPRRLSSGYRDFFTQCLEINLPNSQIAGNKLSYSVGNEKMPVT